MASVTWETILRQRYGEQMQDVLAGTAFAPFAKECGFGLYVIRGAYGTEQSHAAHMELQTMLKGLEATERRQARAISVGSKATGHYKSVQAVTGFCTCLYKYPGTEKHLLYNVENYEALDQPTRWVLALGHGSRVTEFNQVVANLYELDADDAIPSHTDKNNLLEDSTEILSLSMGAPGVFCYEPDIKQHMASPFYELGWNMSRKKSQDAKRQKF